MAPRFIRRSNYLVSIVNLAPKGSDLEAVKKAAKEFAELFIKANCYRYVFWKIFQIGQIIVISTS